MLSGLILTTVACLYMPWAGGGFMASKIMFAAVGISFALIKVSVYSTVGLVTRGTDEHASFMGILEGLFMIGVLSGFWIFGFFINSENLNWLDAYYFLASLAFLAALLLFLTPLDESEAHVEGGNIKEDFGRMFSLIRISLVLVFILCAFFYVFIEQAIQTWLPTFNNKMLHLPESIAVFFSSIYLAALALGRLSAGFLMKKLSWHIVLGSALVMAAILVILVLPLAIVAPDNTFEFWYQAPIAAFLFPLIGFFIAPIYPTLNSTVLSKLPKPRQGPMTGLIVIFSALGGSSGSVITGWIFGTFSGTYAFYFTLVPIAAIFMLLFPYKHLLQTTHFD